MGILRESATPANGSSTAPTFNKPATLNNGDVLIVPFGVRAASNVSAVPTGWTLVDQNVAQAAARAWAYIKVITDAASEPASYAWTLDLTGAWAGGMLRYSGVDTTTPLDVTPANAGGNSTAPAVGGITTVTDGSMIGAFLALDATTSTTAALNDTFVTEVWDTTTGCHNEYDDGVQSAAADTTPVDWTLAPAARQWAAILFALRPVAAGPAAPTVQPDFMRGAFPFLPMTAWRQSGPTGRPGKPRSMHGPSPAGGFDRFLFPRLHPVFAAGDFLLNADPDAYAVSGLDAGTIADRLANADPGTYAVTGTDAQTVADRTVGANTGGYTITGSNADLLADRLVVAAPGVYTITGVAADLVYVPVVGAFVLNANTGSYTTTGIAADPLAARLLNADPGAHTITGTAATVGAGRVIPAVTGSYSTAGVAAGTVAVRMISADTGSYTVGGTTASLVYSGAPAPTVRPAEDFTPVFVTL